MNDTEIDWRARAEAAEAQLVALQPPVMPTQDPGAGFRLVQCDACGHIIANLDDNDGTPDPMRDDLERRLRASHDCA